MKKIINLMDNNKVYTYNIEFTEDFYILLESFKNKYSKVMEKKDIKNFMFQNVSKIEANKYLVFPKLYSMIQADIENFDEYSYVIIASYVSNEHSMNQELLQSYENNRLCFSNTLEFLKYDPEMLKYIPFLRRLFATIKFTKLKPNDNPTNQEIMEAKINSCLKDNLNNKYFNRILSEFDFQSFTKETIYRTYFEKENNNYSKK